MKPEPSLFDDVNDEVEAAADAEAESDIKAGRTVSHAKMKVWLRSWGTSKELPPPDSD